MSNDGKFNLNYEEIILLKGRISKMKKALARISELASRLLGLPSIGRVGDREVHGTIEQIREEATKADEEKWQ